MKLVTLTPQQFTKFASMHKYRNYYQTTAYGNTMIKFGYNIHYLGFVDDNNRLIGATLLLYKEVFMSNKIAYAPRGMLIDYENSKLVAETTEKMKKVLGKQGFMLLRIDPYIPATIRDNKNNVINVNNKIETIKKNLIANGYKYKGETLYFETEKPRWEALVILNKRSGELFELFDKRVRTKIRKATNSGVTVYKDKNKNIDELYKFIKAKQNKPIDFYKQLKESYGENLDIFYAVIDAGQFTSNSRKTYEEEQEINIQLSEALQQRDISNETRNNLLNKKMESDKQLEIYKNNLVKSTELLKINPDGIKIAAAIVISFDNAAYLYIDGINEKYSSVNANYLLRWYMIQEYVKRGYKYINLNGVTGDFDKPNKYSGLTESKLGFNATVTEYIGEFDIVLNQFSYNLYKNFKKKK